GVGAGHVPARVSVMSGATSLADSRRARFTEAEPNPPWSHGTASPEQLDRIEQTIDRGLDEGGLDIGLEINETPAATREEILRLFRIAARRHVPIFAHLRQMGVDPITGSIAGAQEVLADALATGAALHFVHLGSSTVMYAPIVIDMIEAARKRGFDVTGEVYPYNAASTGIQTAMFEGDWQAKLGIGYGDLEWPATGERLTAATFDRYRKQGGAVIVHVIPDKTVDFLVSRPGVIIASDAMPLFDGKGHPRGVGTFARVLGRFVREQKSLSLSEAIRKMSLLPAERLRGVAPAMAKKGRVQVGADADITIFDPATVLDRATFDNPTQASAGIPYVIVNGTVVVQGGEVVPGVHPGRAVKGVGRRK
ncbi:MAG: amidohydrolase family protein, partial [Gemmatimonadota bacterium]